MILFTTSVPEKAGICVNCGMDLYVGLTHQCPTNLLTQAFPPITPLPTPFSTHHYYVSLQCLHEMHNEKCDKACKICGSPCLCKCHGGIG